ncbi:hypothetical protein D9615_000811 [Tricholomella constricta]|uniref:Uncharacterized protein n=1 Tax=Tricholomella constricta TaxID=117010 RepID=A0A8H5HRI2_9AGAR|nr:hypothetical protein D9615_000811 [Tricholomella constricta]
MPPQEYSFRLQKGIVGGFAPPTIDVIHTVTKAATNPSLLIASALRPSGTSTLQDAAPKSLVADHADATTLIEELHGILKDLPMEKPSGSEDIYGLNTSIAWGSEDLEWCNGGPQGCGGGKSEVQPTEEQKEKFRRAVEIVNELVEKGA